jgi:hypothetical protein
MIKIIIASTVLENLENFSFRTRPSLKFWLREMGRASFA